MKSLDKKQGSDSESSEKSSKSDQEEAKEEEPEVEMEEPEPIQYTEFSVSQAYSRADSFVQKDWSKRSIQELIWSGSETFIFT